MEKKQQTCSWQRFLRKIRLIPRNSSNDKNREAEVVPIEFDYKSQHKPPPRTQKDGKLPQNAFRQWNKQQQQHFPIHHGQNNGNSYAHLNQEASRKTALHTDERFTDYINRAKIKIRAMSNLGEEHSAISISGYGGKGEPLDNRFSDFIKHARMKIRTTSSIRDRADQRMLTELK